VLWQITSCEPVFRMDEVKVSQTVNRWNETAGSVSSTTFAPRTQAFWNSPAVRSGATAMLGSKKLSQIRQS